MKTIGVLALQGAFREHIKHISTLGHRGIEIKEIDALDKIDGLIIPGGESTSMGKLLDYFNLKEPIREKIQGGLPVWGTCAGMILLAREIDGGEVPHLNLMDICVKRNAYGRQLGSFETMGNIPEISKDDIPLVFIRAPYILSHGVKVKELYTLESHLVAARQDNMLVTSFHPELTNNTQVHRYFIESLV